MEETKKELEDKKVEDNLVGGAAGGVGIEEWDEEIDFDSRCRDDQKYRRRKPNIISPIPDQKQEPKHGPSPLDKIRKGH